jgi:hypothetical protein
MNSLSDEEFWKWWNTIPNKNFERHVPEAWLECRRRADAIIEQRERKAWKACWSYLFDPGDKDLEEGYRAYQEKQKE